MPASGATSTSTTVSTSVGIAIADLTAGNLLETEAEALVNTVNCVGFMGKGVALQFKQAFPDNYEAYRKACEAGEVQPGRPALLVVAIALL